MSLWKVVVVGFLAGLGIGLAREQVGVSPSVDVLGPPTARLGYGVVYDPHRERLVLFGGRTAGGLIGDTWEHDGERWALMAAAGPPPRQFATLTYDAERRRVVLTGGSGADSLAFEDAWEWDGQRWSERGEADCLDGGAGSAQLRFATIPHPHPHAGCPRLTFARA